MNNDTFGSLVTMVLAAIGLAILAYMLMPTAAGAAGCEKAAGRQVILSPIASSMVQRCWYRGHRVIPKSRPSWSRPRQLSRNASTEIRKLFNQLRARCRA